MHLSLEKRFATKLLCVRHFFFSMRSLYPEEKLCPAIWKLSIKMALKALRAQPFPIRLPRTLREFNLQIASAQRYHTQITGLSGLGWINVDLWRPRYRADREMVIFTRSQRPNDFKVPTYVFLREKGRGIRVWSITAILIWNKSQAPEILHRFSH